MIIVMQRPDTASLTETLLPIVLATLKLVRLPRLLKLPQLEPSINVNKFSILHFDTFSKQLRQFFTVGDADQDGLIFFLQL